jgi:hypothetical protein
MLWIGVYPNPLLRRIEPAVVQVMETMTARGAVLGGASVVPAGPVARTAPTSPDSGESPAGDTPPAGPGPGPQPRKDDALQERELVPPSRGAQP